MLNLGESATRSRERGRWRVLGEEDNANAALQSPGLRQPKLTPKKIGDDYFIGVQNY